MNSEKYDCEKPRILFFTRDYQARLFPKLSSNLYNSYFVTLTRKEKFILIKQNIDIKYCFEDFLYDNLDNINNYSADLITSFYSDRFWGRYNIETRNKLLSCEFKFWNEVLTYYKPLAVINEVVAVENAETLYIIAKQKNVQYWGWLISPFPDRQFYWLNTPFNSSLPKEIFEGEISQDSIEFAKKYLDKLHNNYQRPYYANNIIKRFNIKRIISTFISPAKNYIRYILNRNNISIYLREYYKRSSKINVINSLVRLRRLCASFLYRNYYDNLMDITSTHKVLYPLHYEPEATISYFTEFYQQQDSLIANISMLLGKHQVLVVKEHPQQPGMLLDPKYRELKKQTSNIYFVKSEYQTDILIKQCNCVVTQTSSLGWEALILNKKVVIFGNVFYDKHPAIYKFDGNWQGLRELMRELNFENSNVKQNLDYVAHMWQYCQEGNPFMHKELYKQDNLDRIIESINKRVVENGY